MDRACGPEELPEDFSGRICAHLDTIFRSVAAELLRTGY